MKIPAKDQKIDFKVFVMDQRTGIRLNKQKMMNFTHQDNNKEKNNLLNRVQR